MGAAHRKSESYNINIPRLPPDISPKTLIISHKFPQRSFLKPATTKPFRAKKIFTTRSNPQIFLYSSIFTLTKISKPMTLKPPPLYGVFANFHRAGQVCEKSFTFPSDSYRGSEMKGYPK
jgi:hypothetical protein